MGFIVGKEYRTHPLSHIPGGVTICVRGLNEQIQEYTDVKYPQSYMKMIKRCNPDSEVWIKE